MNLEALIDQETERYTAFRRKYPATRAHGFSSDREFLAFVVQQKRPLIEKWNGMRFTSPVFTNPHLDTFAIQEVATRVRDEFYDTIYGTEVYSRTGYTYDYKPTVRVNESLFRSKLFEPLPGNEGGEQAFADTYSKYGGRSGVLSVKIRKGQAVSKAVLKVVRKEFADNEKYIKYWERFFELLGQAWGSNSHMSFTWSASPADIMHMGLMDCEERRSCYGPGKQSEFTKNTLCVLPGGVMVIGHLGEDAQKPFEERGPLTRAKCRAWGILTPEGAVFSNRYGLSWPKITPLLCAMVQDHYGIERAEAEMRSISYYGIPDMASNGDQHLFAAPGQQGKVWDLLQAHIKTFSYKTLVAEAKQALEAPAVVA